MPAVEHAIDWGIRFRHLLTVLKLLLFYSACDKLILINDESAVYFRPGCCKDELSLICTAIPHAENVMKRWSV